MTFCSAVQCQQDATATRLLDLLWHLKVSMRKKNFAALPYIVCFCAAHDTVRVVCTQEKLDRIVRL